VRPVIEIVIEIKFHLLIATGRKT